MPRSIPRRRSIFVAVEGVGERGFVRWLEGLAPGRGLHVHLAVEVLNGGDPLVMVDEAIRRRNRKGPYAGSVLVLDEDRLVLDRQRAAEARRRAMSSNLELVVQRPKQEGLLLRLFEGHEQRFVAADTVERELLRLWQDYEKPVLARDLHRRFTLGNLLRAAHHDPQIEQLLRIVGLLRT